MAPIPPIKPTSQVQEATLRASTKCSSTSFYITSRATRIIRTTNQVVTKAKSGISTSLPPNPWTTREEPLMVSPKTTMVAIWPNTHSNQLKIIHPNQPNKEAAIQCSITGMGEVPAMRTKCRTQTSFLLEMLLRAITIMETVMDKTQSIRIQSIRIQSISISMPI